MVRENQELRDRMSEDAALYRRRIDTYRQAQQNQAALVARLQSKVLQYRRKYNDLEERVCDMPSTPEITKVHFPFNAVSLGFVFSIFFVHYIDVAVHE